MARERATCVSVAGREEIRLRLFRTDLYGPFPSQGELWAQGWIDEWAVHLLGNCYPFCILGNFDECWHALDFSMQVTFRIIKTLAVLS